MENSRLPEVGRDSAMSTPGQANKTKSGTLPLFTADQPDQPRFPKTPTSFHAIAGPATILAMPAYTLREAADALGVSTITVRRYIKSGKLRATLVPSKFGYSYIIDELPMVNKPLSNNALSTQPLINRIEQLSQEVGYWKARAEWLQERVLLLESPKQTIKHRWWQRLFRPRH
jgi:excisionase family DNA binding protein